MNLPRNILITCDFTALSPIHQTLPKASDKEEKGVLNTATMSVVGVDADGKPAIMTKKWVKDESEKGGAWTTVAAAAVKIPYFTANGLRGMFRRIGANIIIDAKILGDERFESHVIDLLRCGAGRGPIADFGKPTNNFNTVMSILTNGQAKAYCDEKNVHTSLFGAGLSAVPSDLRISNLLPVIMETAGLFNLDPKETDRPSVSDVFHSVGWSRKSGLQNHDNSMDAVVDQADLAMYRAHRAEELAEKAAKGDGESDAAGDGNDRKDADRLVMEHIGVIKAIAPGTPLRGAMTIMNATPKKVGLIFRIWQAFAADPYIGAMRRHGWGKVSFNLSFHDASRDDIALANVVSRDGSFTVDSLNKDKLDLEDCGREFDKWLAAVTMEELDIVKGLKAQEPVLLSDENIRLHSGKKTDKQAGAGKKGGKKAAAENAPAEGADIYGPDEND